MCQGKFNDAETGQSIVRGSSGRAYGGSIVSTRDNSNYGRVFRTFEERFMPLLTSKSIVVVLGDGRTNYHDDGSDALGRIAQDNAVFLSGNGPLVAVLREALTRDEVLRRRSRQE